MIDPEKERVVKIAAKSYGGEWDGDEEITEQSIIEELSNLVSSNDENFARRGFHMQIPTDFSLSFLSNNHKSIIEKVTKFSGEIHIGYKDWSILYIDPIRNKELSKMLKELSDKEIKIYAKIYWDEIPYSLSDASDESLDFEAKTFSTYSYEYINFDKKSAIEIYGDVMSDYLEEGFKNDYDKFKSTFFDDIRDEFKERGNEIITLLEAIDVENLVNVAIEYYRTEEDYIDEFINNLILDSEIESEKRPEVILTIPREILVKWGIKSGTFYENAPWNLVRLDIGHLRKEGRVMRHCVGYTNYAVSVFKKEIEIWSLRNKDGNPRFTFEVSSGWNESEDTSRRARHFRQIKGKTNRLAGYESPRSTEIKFTDEVIFISSMLTDMNVDPAYVTDLDRQIGILSEK